MDEIMKSDSPAGSGEPAEELSVEQSFEKLDLYEKKMLVLGEDGVVEEFE